MPEVSTASEKSGAVTNNEVEISSVPSDFPGNPVGKLQELTILRRWPPPTYEETQLEGKSHNSIFRATCKLGKFVETGEL